MALEMEFQVRREREREKGGNGEDGGREKEGFKVCLQLGFRLWRARENN